MCCWEYRLFKFLPKAAQRAPSLAPCRTSTGAVVAGAQVQIINQGTGAAVRTVKTDANGGFSAQLLPVGVYTISVKSSGFAEETFSGVDVRITETTRVTAKLRPQTQQQKIEVQAEVQQVETSTATTGQVIEPETIRSLPLATQNFQQLLTLSTGAQGELNSSTQLGRGNVRIFVNGQREDNNNYLIEGISATDYNVAELTTTPLPNPDVIEEFKVQTFSLRCHTRTQWRRQHQRHSQVGNENLPRRCVRVFPQHLSGCE